MNNDKQINVTTHGDTLIIREGQAPKVFEYQGFRYTADSKDSLIALVKSKSVKPNCVIAYNEKGFEAILDDTISNREQDRVSYHFKKSQQYQEWRKILEGDGCVFGQKNLIDFLRRREPGEIIDMDVLIAAIQNFKYVSNIAGDFTFDDRNNYTFAFKIGDAEGTVKLPQTVNAYIEILNESNFKQCMEIEIEVQKPKSEGEKLLFLLQCPKLSRYLKEAVDQEIEGVKAGLDGYLIVAGSI
jgi:hypothetical protein